MVEASRRSLFRVHAWIGLNLGFLLFVICFSGTVAVFSTELNWLADPSLRVEPPPAGERGTISLQEMHDRVAAAHPHALILYLFPPRGERWAALAVIAYTPQTTQWVMINPYSGALQGQRSGFNLASFFRIFHKQLYVVPSVLWLHGTLLVGSLAILLLAGALAGLVTVRRWWRPLSTLRRGRSARLFWSDLHRLCGIWPLLITIVLSLTGIWYLAENILQSTGALGEEAAPARLSADELRRQPAELRPLDLDRAAALARAAYPKLAISQIGLPLRPGDPLTFAGQAEAWLVRDRANRVRLDPYSGEVLAIERAVEFGALDRWIETADPLHFGTFAGLISQVLWCAGGVLLCGGILAGLYGAWLRLGQRGGGVPRRRWLAAGAAVLPTVVILAASLYGTWAYGGEALRAAQRPLSVTLLGEGDLGPWEVAVYRHGPAAAAGPLSTSIHFIGGGHPNFERALLWIGDPEQPAEATPPRRFVDRLVGQVDHPRGGCPGQCLLNLRIEDRSGRPHHLSLALSSKAAASTALPVASGLTAGETGVIGAFGLVTVLVFLGWLRLQLHR